MYGKGKMTPMHGRGKTSGREGAGKIPRTSTPLAGNNAGNNVMLRKNTASSTPTQMGSRNFGAPMIRVPNTLKSGRGR